jgi:hypothetical protein
LGGCGSREEAVTAFVNTNTFWFHKFWKYFDKLSNYWLLKDLDVPFGAHLLWHVTMEGPLNEFP